MVRVPDGRHMARFPLSRPSRPRLSIDGMPPQGQGQGMTKSADGLRCSRIVRHMPHAGRATSQKILTEGQSKWQSLTTRTTRSTRRSRRNLGPWIPPNRPTARSRRCLGSKTTLTASGKS